jgi:hypothetical protein
VPAETVHTLETSAGVGTEAQTCSSPGSRDMQRLSEQAHGQRPSL